MGLKMIYQLRVSNFLWNFSKYLIVLLNVQVRYFSSDRYASIKKRLMKIVYFLRIFAASVRLVYRYMWLNLIERTAHDQQVSWFKNHYFLVNYTYTLHIVHSICSVWKMWRHCGDSNLRPSGRGREANHSPTTTGRFNIISL